MPVASLSLADLTALVDASWMPSGPSGAPFRNRVQQLVGAVCRIRPAISSVARVPMAERHVWRQGVVATDDVVARTRASLGLGLVDFKRVDAAPALALAADVGGKSPKIEHE
jgi:hypothetical protein